MDQQRRQRQMPSTLVDTDVSTPHNLNQYNINWSGFEVQGFELPCQSQQYVHAIACACRFGIQRGILLEHDYGSDRGLCTWDNPNPELLYPYYLLTSQDLTVKDAPLPSRDNQMLFWAHATTVGGLHAILKFRNMAPKEAHNMPNNNTFYAIGHPMCGCTGHPQRCHVCEERGTGHRMWHCLGILSEDFWGIMGDLGQGN